MYIYVIIIGCKKGKAGSIDALLHSVTVIRVFNEELNACIARFHSAPPPPPRDITPDIFLSLTLDDHIYTKRNTVSLLTFREPLPNKTQQRNQRRAKKTIHVEKYMRRI